MPGIWMTPLAFFTLESSSISPKIGLGAAPPYRPECRSRAGPGSFHFHVDQAAQADAQRRNAVGEKLGIGNQRDIGLQLFGILGHVLGDGFAADFLLAFDQKLHVDGQRAVRPRAALRRP